MQLRCVFYDDKIEEMLFFNRCLRECSWKMITWDDFRQRFQSDAIHFVLDNECSNFIWNVLSDNDVMRKVEMQLWSKDVECHPSVNSGDYQVYILM